MFVLKPSKKKIFFYSLLFMLLSAICFFIEVLSNKITHGTELIRIYEAIFFYLLACYYLIQLIPGYAKFIIDKNGFREIWFFRQRINISWLAMDSQQCKQNRAGDTLYINGENEHVFSRKMVCKGTYPLADKDVYQKILQQLNDVSKSTQTNGKHYLVLGQMKATLLISLTVLIIAFNSYYLNNEETDAAFIEQVNYWQQQAYTDEQLFESFKVYGYYWKNQLKQVDRKLYQRILLQESRQIENALLKRHINMTDADKQQFKQKLTDCKNKYLFYDEVIYLQCLEKL